MTQKVGMDISVKAAGATQVDKLANSLIKLQSISLRGLTSKINSLENMMKPFKDQSAAKGLNKFSNALNKLQTINIGNAGTSIKNIATALRPLTDEMNRGAVAAQSYAAVLSKLSTKAITSGNAFKKASGGFNIFRGSMQKIIATFYIAGRLKDMMGGWIREANNYIENLNLFAVAMGTYYNEAVNYAQRVGDTLGIDPSQWMRQQGIIMDMAKSFGVAADQAYIMSKALTQIAYDFSSLYNLDIDLALKKVQSGLAGEIEPLRRIGKDLSVAKMQLVATELGISQNVSKMTQADKAMLRTIVLLRQSGSAMGDLARTINSPANQLRIFNAQVIQLKRALGYILLPTLQIILPYLIAMAKVLRIVAEIIAGLFNFQLPKFNYDSLSSNLALGASDSAAIADNMKSSAKSAAKINSYRAGFDELNVIDKNAGAAGGGTGGAGGGGIGGGQSDVLAKELERLASAYDKTFLANVDDKVTTIVGHMLEWLGIGKLITDENGNISLSLNPITTWAEFFDTRLGNIIQGAATLGTIIAGWKIASGIYTLFTEGLGPVALGGLTSATTGIGNFIARLPVLIGGFASIIPLVLGIIGAIVLVGTAIYQLWQENEDFRQKVSLIWQGIQNVLQTAWEQILKPIFDAIIAIILAVWEYAIKPLMAGLLDLWDGFKEMVKGVLDILFYLWAFLEPIFLDIIGIIGEVLKWLLKFWGPVVITGIKLFGATIGAIFKAIKIVFDVFIGIIKTAEEVLKAFFTGNWKGLGDNLAGIWSGVWDKVKDSFHSLVQSLVSGFAALVNFFGGGINAIIKTLNKLPGVEIGLIPTWNPRIPAFEGGGFPEEDGMFMANHNELVGQFRTPSGTRNAVVNNAQIIEGTAAGVGAAVEEAMTKALGAGNNEVAVVDLDGERLFRLVRKYDARKGHQIVQAEYAR